MDVEVTENVFLGLFASVCLVLCVCVFLGLSVCVCLCVFGFLYLLVHQLLRSEYAAEKFTRTHTCRGIELV